MKILNLVFHPNLAQSRVNRSWKRIFDESGKVTTSVDMYSRYPDFVIDVEREQADLLFHDRIILQFPMYWYSMTPLLKKWLDDVLTYGFAYGSSGNELQGKDLQVIVSVGGQPHFYSGFDIYATVHELMRPFQLTANLCRMNYMLPLWMFRADAVDEEVIEEHGQRWADIIDDPMRSDAKAYLRSLPDGSE